VIAPTQWLWAAAVALAAAAVVGCDGGAPAASSRVYLAGDGELWIVDVAAERVRRVPLRRLAPGDPPHRIVRRGRQLVLWGNGTYVSDPRFRLPLRTLARRSSFFIPSAHPGRVWVAYLDRRLRSLRAVREMTAGGRVTVRGVRPPGGRWPERALAGGLLLPAGNGGHVVWDPLTRVVVRRFPERTLGELGPAHRDVLASCPAPCRSLRLTDTRTGARRDVPARAGFRFEVWEAAFAPDGRRLAVPVRRPGARARGPRRLAIVDVAAGRTRLVPGSRVPAGYTLIAWSASGGDAFITGGERFGARTIVAYSVGAARARALRVDVGDFYDIAAL
jgi:hypothetical protein